LGYSDEEIIGKPAEIDIEDMITEEDMVVSITHSGYIKRSPVSLYRSQHRGGKGITGMVTKEWTSIHRKHHAKCETEDDPHSPQVFGLSKVLWEGTGSREIDFRWEGSRSTYEFRKRWEGVLGVMERRYRDTTSEKRRQELEEQIAGLTQQNIGVDPVQLLRLSDVINIAAKHEPLRSQLGFASRRAVENALGGLNDLRNRTMHPVRPLLSRLPEDMERLQRYGQQAGEILRRLEIGG